MTRDHCLNAAHVCVTQDRENTYGGPERSFEVTALLWSPVLGVEVQPHQVALCLALLKVARLTANPTHGDSWVDLAGYAACGAEVAGAIIPKAV